jgi:hypothetical protein
MCARDIHQGNRSEADLTLLSSRGSLSLPGEGVCGGVSAPCRRRLLLRRAGPANGLARRGFLSSSACLSGAYVREYRRWGEYPDDSRVSDKSGGRA